MNLWTSFFVEISHFKNDVAESQKCIDSNANYLLNIPKSARVYNWPLSSLLSTPDRLQQYSLARASCEFHYLEEQCRKRSWKVTFVVCNQSGSISTVSLTLRIVSVWFEPRSNCRSCCPIVRGRVVLKKAVVDTVLTLGLAQAGKKSYETSFSELKRSVEVSRVTFYYL